MSKRWRKEYEKKYLFIFLLLSVLCFAEPSQEEGTCLPPAQLSLSHHFGRGVGHKDYTSADLFFIRTAPENFSPFLDLRLHVMNEGKIASNVGVGFRTFPWERISIGGNLYYDYRASSHLHTYQVAGGFELLSEYLDFRLNGYLPVGGRKHSDPLLFDGFSGNQIDVSRKTYYAYPVVNGEFGVPLPWISPEYTDFYVAVGPYYLFGKTVSENHYEGSWGFKGRLTALITDYIELGFEYNYDRVYRSTYQGIISFNIPLYKNTACRPKGGVNKGQKAYAKRTLRRVMRNEIIPVKKKNIVRPLKDSNGNIIQAYFVNNTIACPGLGTFETPFCSTALAEAAAPQNALFYVFQGTGTTFQYDTGFVMKPGQILQGSSQPLTLYGVTIPPQTIGNPVLTGPQHGVTVASYTNVRGISVENTGWSGIFGGTVTDVVIENNQVSGAGIHGIRIEDHMGFVSIVGNSVDASAQNGISIDNSNFPGSSYILNNIVNNSVTDGILVRTNHPDAFSRVAYNTITRSVSPGLFVGDIGTEVQQGYVEIVNNTMNSNTCWAIHALDGHQLIANNIINNTSALAGQAITYSVTALPGDPRIVILSNNQISVQAAGRDGIDVRTVVADNFFTNISGNQVTTTDPATGIRVYAEFGAFGCAVLTGNTAPTYSMEGVVPSAINMQQTQAAYNSANTATTGFTEVGTVNFGTGCTGP